MHYASAGRSTDLRPLTAQESLEQDEFNRQMAGQPPDDVQRFRLNVIRGLNGDSVLDGPEHAAHGAQTLCGLRASEIFLMRHHFNSADERACPVCASHTPPVR